MQKRSKPPNPSPAAAPPLVVIAGRPNVGKSTLFNRLIGRRRSIEDFEAGTTRDELYGRVAWRGKTFILADAAGFLPGGEDDLAGPLQRKLRSLYGRADLFLFVVDARSGLLPHDEEVSDLLRRARRPVVFCANKVERRSQQSSLADFARLGRGLPLAISAAQGLGLGDLLDEICRHLPANGERPLPAPDARIAICGRPNVGKSTLLNLLSRSERALVSPRPGTTRDPVEASARIGRLEAALWDTPGLRRRSRVKQKLEYITVRRGLKTIEQSDLAILLLDASEGIVSQDQQIARFIAERHRAAAVAVNKWDLVPDKRRARETWAAHIAAKFPHLAYAPSCFISAAEGKGIESLSRRVCQAMDQFRRVLPTRAWNKELEAALQAHHPPREARLFYAVQTGTAPPRLSLFGRRTERLPASYTRYLEKRFRQAFGFQGSPLVTHYREAPEQGRGKVC